MVQGKNRKINYKVKQSRPIDEASWIRVEETHEAIIPKPIFEIVQRLTELDTRTAPASDSVYTLSGFLRCGDCGQNMIRRTVMKKDKPYNYYYCSTYKRGDGCTSHNISEAKLMTNVLAVVQHQIRLLVEADRILSAIDELPTQNLGVKSVDTQIAALEAEIERYKDLKSKVYKDMTDGIVSRDEFKDINTRFTNKINSAKTAQEELIAKREKLLSRENTSRPWMETFREYRNVSELDRKMIA